MPGPSLTPRHLDVVDGAVQHYPGHGVGEERVHRAGRPAHPDPPHALPVHGGLLRHEPERDELGEPARLLLDPRVSAPGASPCRGAPRRGRTSWWRWCGSPMRCAALTTLIHSRTVILPGDISSRMRWSSISAEVPGSVPTPRLLEPRQVLFRRDAGTGTRRTRPPRGRSRVCGCPAPPSLWPGISPRTSRRPCRGAGPPVCRPRWPRASGPRRPAHYLLRGQHVRLAGRRPGVPAERAEPAPLHARVGEVDVPVHDVRDRPPDPSGASARPRPSRPGGRRGPPLPAARRPGRR